MLLMRAWGSRAGPADAHDARPLGASVATQKTTKQKPLRGGRRHWRPAQFCFAEGRRPARPCPGRPGLKGPPMLGPWGPRAARFSERGQCRRVFVHSVPCLTAQVLCRVHAWPVTRLRGLLAIPDCRSFSASALSRLVCEVLSTCGLLFELLCPLALFNPWLGGFLCRCMIINSDRSVTHLPPNTCAHGKRRCKIVC